MPTPDEELTSFLEEATATYQERLPNSLAAELLDDRRIGESARLIARLGFTGSEPMPGHEQFANMLSIPYITPTGVRAVKFRRLTGDGPKYTAPIGQRVRMYNVLALAQASDTIYVAEGELDTCILHHQLGIPAVGIAGVSQFKSHFPRVLRGFANVIVVTDNDLKEDGSNPGQDLARRIIDAIPRARNVSLPAGMDINEVLITEGEESLRHRLGVHV